MSRQVAAAMCLVCYLQPAAAKDVHTLSLQKYLKGYWNVVVQSSVPIGSIGEEAETKGYLEFEQDPSDRNGLVSDLFIYASDSAGEVNTNAGSRKTADGGVYRGKVQLKLLTSTSGLLLYTSEDETRSEELLKFEFSRNSNLLHIAHGSFLPSGRDRGGLAMQSTILAANHFQVTVFAKVSDRDCVISLSAKKGVPSSKQETWLQRWGPSVLVLVFFIASKFLRKKYGKGSDFMKERQGMPPGPRKMPPAKNQEEAKKSK